MDNEYITIKEATTLLGKSEITIRRLIKKLLTSTDKDVVKKVKDGSGFVYTIRKSYLAGTQSPTQPTTQNGNMTSQVSSQNDKAMSSQMTSQDSAIWEVVRTLQDELKAKNKVIEDLMAISKKNTELIYSLNAQVYQITSGKEPPVVSDNAVKDDGKVTTDTPIKKETKPSKSVKRGSGKTTKKATTQGGTHLTSQTGKLSTHPTSQTTRQMTSQKRKKQPKGKDGKFRKKGFFERLFS